MIAKHIKTFLTLIILSFAVNSMAALAAEPKGKFMQGSTVNSDATPAWTFSTKGQVGDEITDIVQSLVDTQTKQEVVRFAIAKQKKTNNIGVLIKVPLGLRLDTGVAIRIDGKDTNGINDIRFSRCLADGCYAEKPISAAQLNQLKAAKSLEIVVLDLAGQAKIVKIETRDLANQIAKL